MRLPDKLHILYGYMLTRYGRRWPDRAALERWQEARVIRHLAWVRERSPFYRELWGQRPLSGWRSFPEIDKNVMMEHFAALNTHGVSKEEALERALAAERTRDFTPMLGELTIGLSSGTSGNRGLFLVSRQERLSWAGAVLAKALPGAIWSKQSVAFFLRANSNLYGTVGSGRLRFEFYDLLDPMERHAARLNEQQPSVLVAPPSMLRLLAQMRRQGAVSVQPHRIVSVAEVLDPLDRIYIEETFGRPLHQVYQCTEGFLAATCDCGTLHLNEDLVSIQRQYVDREQRKFIPVITDFSRTAQPIVRYRLNDLLTESGRKCICGSPFLAIEAIEGRCDDLFYLPSVADSRQWIPLFPDYVSRAIIAASADIEAYRAVLHEPSRLEISLQVEESRRSTAEFAVSGAISALCATAGCVKPQLMFTPYRFVPGPHKLRRVERRFELDERHAAIR